MTDRPPGEALIPQCETRKVGDTTYISVPGPVPVIEAAGTAASLDDHFESHLDDTGLCQCSCEDCTTRTVKFCVCEDCRCESNADHAAWVWGATP